MYFDEGAQASRKEKPGNHPDRTGEYSCYDRLCAAVDTIAALPTTAPEGLAERFEHLKKNPEDAVFLAATGYACGLGLSIIGRSPHSAMTKVAAHLSKAMFAGTLVDLGMRTTPIYSAWSDPARSDTYAKQLGKNLGSLLIDYSVAGASGLAGAKTYRFLPNRTYSTTALEGDIYGLSEVIKANFERPPQTAYSGSRPGYATSFNMDHLNACTKKLEDGINSYQRLRNRPEIEVTWHVGSEDSRGCYLTGNSKISIHADALTHNRYSQVAALVGHELTHGEQDLTAIRRMADKLGIGKTFSDEQISQLKTFSEKQMGSPYSDGLLIEALRLRNGEKLSAAQSLRADTIIAEVIPYQENSSLQSLLSRRKVNLQQARSTVQKQGPESILEQLKSEPRRVALFGSSELPKPVQTLIEQTAKTPATAKAEWNRLLTDEIRTVNRGLDDCFSKYRNSLLEQEANSVGFKIAYHNFIGTNKGQILMMAASAVPTSLAYHSKEAVKRSTQ